MEFKEEILDLLFRLKRAGITRRKIEKDLNYKEFYIDQEASKGDNKRFVSALRKYANQVLSKQTEDVTTIVVDANVIIQEMSQDLIRLKAAEKVQGIWIAELSARLKKTSVASEAALLQRSVDEEVGKLFLKLKKKK